MADQQDAMNYLGGVCVPSDPTPPALLTQWSSAQAQLGTAFPNAGQPTVGPIPHGHDAHAQTLLTAAWLAPFFAEGWELRVVEPMNLLLAFQVHVDLDRSDVVCACLPTNPTLTDALQLCLPTNPPPLAPVFPAGNPERSFIFKSPSLDFRIVNKGFFPPPTNLAGIQIGMAPAFAQVVRFNGRCYLRNGFHRTYGLCSRQFQQLPCMYREAKTFKEVAEGPPATFGQELLESTNPPTLGHFSQGRAYGVALRKFSRVIHIDWSEYVVPEE
jgi:hypothetical protein